MTNQREFAIPKEKQKVTVHLTGGETLPGTIFLEYIPEAVTLHQKVTAFLEDENEFFPLAADGDGPQFISKRSLRMLEVEYPEEESTFSLMHIEDITAVFSDGSQVGGMLMADVPAEKARLSDCLNLPGRFLSVWAGGPVLFINKDAVRKVVYASGS
jgi:hypothetical protein